MSYDATKSTLHHALDMINSLMKATDKFATSASTRLQGNSTALDILNYYTNLAGMRQKMIDVVSEAPIGLVDYVRSQTGDTSVDPVAEYLLVRGAIEDVLDTIASLLPVSDIYLQVVTLTATGYDWRAFTPAQTNPVKIRMDILKAMIIS